MRRLRLLIWPSSEYCVSFAYARAAPAAPVAASFSPHPYPPSDATRKWAVRVRNAISFPKTSSRNGVTTTPWSAMCCLSSPLTPAGTMHSAGRYRAISEITFWKLLSCPVTVTKNSPVEMSSRAMPHSLRFLSGQRAMR